MIDFDDLEDCTSKFIYDPWLDIWDEASSFKAPDSPDVFLLGRSLCMSRIPSVILLADTYEITLLLGEWYTLPDSDWLANVTALQIKQFFSSLSDVALIGWRYSWSYKNLSAMSRLVYWTHSKQNMAMLTSTCMLVISKTIYFFLFRGTIAVECCFLRGDWLAFGELTMLTDFCCMVFIVLRPSP